jgi:peptidoglycan hydrolase CwlO-like protein
MSEEKLDLILTVVSELKGDVGKLDSKVNSLEKKFDSKVDSLEKKFDSKVDSLEKKFDSKIDSLEKKFDSKISSLEKEIKDFRGEFKDFKKQVIEAIKQLNKRIDTLEKQMFAIGFELKEEIRREIKSVRADIEFIDRKLMIEQEENIKFKFKVTELEKRITKLEEQVKLAA